VKDSGYTVNDNSKLIKKKLMEQQTTITQYKSVNLTIYFNADLDDGEVQDFIERMTDKYNHPDDIIRDYEYWYDE